MITTYIEDVEDLTIAHLLLEKPSNLTEGPAIWKEGCLYILDVTDGFSLRILKEIKNENILHLEASCSVNLSVDKYYLLPLC